MKQMVNFGVSVWIKRNPLIVYLQEIIRVYRQTSNKRIKFRMHLLKFSHDNNSQSNILKKRNNNEKPKKYWIEKRTIKKDWTDILRSHGNRLCNTISQCSKTNNWSDIPDKLWRCTKASKIITGSTNIRLSQLTSLGQLFLQIDLQLLYSSSSKNT